MLLCCCCCCPSLGGKKKFESEMNKNTLKKSKVPSSSAAPKPSKQSLIARGLAANEEKALQRIQGGKPAEESHRNTATYLFYNSSDSDADPVYSMNKKLNRCASLLKNIMNDDVDNTKVKKSKLEEKTNKQTRNDKKKVVKIVLPDAVKMPKPSATVRPTRQKAKKSNMVTSTPRTMEKKAPKSKMNRENKLKEEIAQIEIEKSLLQDQFSELLKHHVSTPKRLPMQKTASFTSLHQHATQRSPQALLYSNLTTPKSHNSKDSSSSFVFKELEKTISGISEKLSFPVQTFARKENSILSSQTEPMHQNFGDFVPGNGSVVAMEGSRMVDDGIDRKMVEQRAVRWSEMAPIEGGHENLSVISRSSSGSSKSNPSSDEDLDNSSLHSNSEDDNTLIDVRDQALRDSLDKVELESYSDSDDEVDASDQTGRPQNKVLQEEGIPNRDQALQVIEKPVHGKTVRFEKSEEKIGSSDSLIDNATERGLLFEAERSDSAGTKSSTPEAAINKMERCSKEGSDCNGENAKSGTEEKREARTVKDSVRGKKLSKNKQEGKGIESGSSKTTEATGDNQAKRAEKQFYRSPNSSTRKPLLDVVSQLGVMRNSDNMKAKPLSAGVEIRGIKPGYAATQITALSYLFKELTSLLADRINSEESRLLTEVDHMIGLLPFLINNLDPNLQTEISLAVQPLRLENSDLRRQLRIANQKIRDFEINIKEMQDSLLRAQKNSLDEFQMEKLRSQLRQDESARKILEERISGLTKTTEDLRKENLRVMEQITVRDAEIVRQKQLWQKEKTSVYTENDLARNRLESLSLSLQGKDKENRILKVSLTQSEAEVVRLTQLNTELRNSVAKLLRDVDFQDARAHERESKATYTSRRHRQEGPAEGTPARARTGHTSAHYRMPPSVPYKQAWVTHEVVLKPNKDFGELKTSYHDALSPLKLLPSSDQENDFLSSTTISDLTTTATVSSVNSCNGFEPSGNFDDQYSTLTCDSQEFRTNLANLSSNIKQMQQSLCNAKRA